MIPQYHLLHGHNYNFVVPVVGKTQKLISFIVHAISSDSQELYIGVKDILVRFAREKYTSLLGDGQLSPKSSKFSPIRRQNETLPPIPNGPESSDLRLGAFYDHP
jgi:hypothetical protein